MIRLDGKAFALGFVVLSAVSACSGDSPEPAVAGAPEPPAIAEPAPTAALARNWGAQVQLEKVSYDQWLRELGAFRGRIVVVDNWATWCAPCTERFPKMVAMSKKWKPERVTFVSLSLDDRDDPDSIAQVREYLRSQDARIPNYLMDEVVPDAFEKLDLLGIPAVFVYDAQGTLRYRLTGDDPNHQFTEADVEAAVRTLAKEGEASPLFALP